MTKLDSNQLKRTGYTFDDENIKVDVENFFGTVFDENKVKKYRNRLFELLEYGKIQTGLESFILSIRVNSSVPGPRWHTDGILRGAGGTYQEYTKYGLALGGPSPYILNDPDSTLYKILREQEDCISHEYSKDTLDEDEIDRLQTELNSLIPADMVTTYPDNTIVSWTIGGENPTFHSEPENPVHLRVFAQIIPCTKDDLLLML